MDSESFSSFCFLAGCIVGILIFWAGYFTGIKLKLMRSEINSPEQDFTQEVSRNHIGEVYCREHRSGLTCTYIDPASMKEFLLSDRNAFKKFGPLDHTERCPNGDVKIFGVWHKKENVIFYDEIYDAKRERIKKRFEVKK